MVLTIFQRFRRRRGALGNSGILREGNHPKKQHRFQWRGRNHKKHTRRQDTDPPFDGIHLGIHDDDTTDRESCDSTRSSRSHSSDTNTNTTTNGYGQTTTGSRTPRSSNRYSYSYRQNSSETKLAHVGRPPKRFLRKEETMTFRIHGFAQRAEQRGEYILTPTLQAHGYHWKLQIYPRGNHRSDPTSEYVSCFLHYFQKPPPTNHRNRNQNRHRRNHNNYYHRSRAPPSAKIQYSCGPAVVTETQVCTFCVQEGKCSTSWGLEDWILRTRALQTCLDADGALTVHVKLQMAVDQTVVWYPPAMVQEPTLVQLYQSTEETGDATFCVRTTAWRQSPSKSHYNCHYYKAHKMILALRGRMLYELVCDETSSVSEGEEGTAFVVDLPGVDPPTLEAMLQHIYTLQQPAIHDQEGAKKLLVAADRFCLTHLKLYVESVLVDRFATPRNAASLLLFADSHSCALLKERAMDLYAEDPDAVVATSSWTSVEESERILSELSNHVHTGYCQNHFSKTRNNIDDDGDEEEDDLDRCDIFSIREQLCEYGLDADGSRDTLLERLRKHCQKAAQQRK